MQKMDYQDNNEEKNCTGSCCTDLGRGCSFCEKADGVEVKACEGCFKLHEYNWLKDMPDVFPTNIFEVRFKNTRKGYYSNVNDLPLQQGDIVAVESSPGHDVGIISLTGDLVARQMKRVGFNPQNGEFKKIYRKAKPYDIEKWQEAIALEHETMIHARQIAAEMNLNMKIGDVEYQGDKIKAIFYYIADERVDFRELIKVFAEQFRIRIEMKQIGARQEAGRIGGLGSCGRELCCASWISNFVSVTTNSARHQEISLNPQKLAGQCGKLKCCLVYELDAYMDARREFPRINAPLETIDGQYFLIKSDILNRTMWFSSDPTSQANMIPLSIERVREVIKANQRGEKVEQLSDEQESDDALEPTFANVVGEESLTRFDKQKRRNRKKKRAPEERQSARDGQAPSDESPAESTGTADKQANASRPTSGDRPQRNRNENARRNPVAKSNNADDTSSQPTRNDSSESGRNDRGRGRGRSRDPRPADRNAEGGNRNAPQNGEGPRSNNGRPEKRTTDANSSDNAGRQKRDNRRQGRGQHAAAAGGERKTDAPKPQRETPRSIDPNPTSKSE